MRIPNLSFRTSAGTRRAAASLALLLPLFSLSACQQRQRPLYAVIPKGQAHVFWQTVHAGAAAAEGFRRVMLGTISGNSDRRRFERPPHR